MSKYANVLNANVKEFYPKTKNVSYYLVLLNQHENTYECHIFHFNMKSKIPI